MRHLLLDPREVDAERKVVMEERRTRTEDDPVGALAELFNTVAFAAHPYRLADDRARPGHRAPDGERPPEPGTTPTTGPTTRSSPPSGTSGRPSSSRRSGRGSAPSRAAPTRRALRGGARAARRAAGLAAEGGAAARRLRGLSGAEPPIGGRLPARGPVGGPLGRADVAALPAARVRGAARPGGRRRLPAPHARPGHVHLLRDGAARAHGRGGRARARAPRWSGCARSSSPRRSSSAPRTSWRRAYLFGQDSVFSRSATLARHELLGGWRLREAYLPGIRAVTREDVRRVAERHLVAERRTTAILVPRLRPPGRSAAR